MVKWRRRKRVKIAQQQQNKTARGAGRGDIGYHRRAAARSIRRTMARAEMATGANISVSSKSKQQENGQQHGSARRFSVSSSLDISSQPGGTHLRKYWHRNLNSSPLAASLQRRAAAWRQAAHVGGARQHFL